MTIKACLLPLLLLCCIAAGAQDKIYKTDGSVVDGKVKNITSATITYGRPGDAGGSTISVPRHDVKKIVYQNGYTDDFEKEASKAGKPAGGQKPRNIFSIMPGVYTVMPDESMKDPGVGICYERLLDEKGHLSVAVPVILSFSQNTDYRYYSYGGYPVTKSYYGYMFMPGVRIYPADMSATVRYSVGASMFAGFGSEPEWAYSNAGVATGEDWHYHMYGVMITNSVNINVGRKFYMAVDMNGGIPFADNRYNDASSFDVAFSMVMQFAVRAGIRF